MRLTPRASRDRIDRVETGGVLHAWVQAAPVEGAANRALCRLLAASLAVPLSAIALEAGASGRRKRVRVEGVGPDAVAARWPGLAVDARSGRR